MGDVKAIMPAVGWGVVGMTGNALAVGALSRVGVPIPDRQSNPMAHYAARFIAAIGLGWVAGAVMGRHTGRLVLTGGALGVASEVANQFVMAPLGLQTYLPDSMGTYLQDEGDEMGYESPGMTVGDDYGEGPVIRLDPARRF